MVNLKAAPPETSAAISFPPSTAQKWILSNGLTVIVDEDRSAPGGECAGVVRHRKRRRRPAPRGWGCPTFSNTCCSKGPKRSLPIRIAQSIQNVGGYINAYTSFDRTVFWIDVPKDGVGHGAGSVKRRDDEFHPAPGGIQQRAGSHPARVRDGHGRSRSRRHSASFCNRISAASLPLSGHRRAGELTTNSRKNR